MHTLEPLAASSRYKCPLLRGPVDPQITKHGQFEKLMTSDLENWLCNFYFEIVKLPRYSMVLAQCKLEHSKVYVKLHASFGCYPQLLDIPIFLLRNCKVLFFRLIL